MSKEFGPTIHTVGALRAVFADVPDDRLLATQVVGTTKHTPVWSMFLSASPNSFGGHPLAVLSVWHKDLPVLPEVFQKSDADEHKNKAITIDYTNWKGLRETRKIIPTGKLTFKSTPYHTIPQWIMEAWCEERQALREFALKDIHSFHHSV